MSLFITCPVDSVERSIAFYTALGWTPRPEFSGPEVACFEIADGQLVMLSGREAYASVGDTDDYPFMYQRQFDDPDGYHYSPFWMKPAAEPAA
ncbi:VOC family protein [Brachybacterium sp. DNPG3]